MSLEKSGATFVASCDFCSNSCDTEESDFLSAVDAMKRLGWRIFKHANEWFHKCDACLEAELEDDFGNVE